MLQWKPLNVIKLTRNDDVPNNCHLSTLFQKETAYCYHSVNVVTLTPAQSDHIKRLPLYNKEMFILYIKGLHNRPPEFLETLIIDIIDYDTIRFDSSIIQCL